MQTDLSNVLTRLATAVAMTFIPVAPIAVLSMPASLHHHFGSDAAVAHAPPSHMT